MENQLEIIVKESGLETTKANFILEKFQGYFKLASEWEIKAKDIKVTDETQVTDMKMAKVGRLFLRDKRVDIEKARKALKEQALREGKAIDGIANVLKALIAPIEEYLERQEKFVEIKQKEKEEAERIAAEQKAEEERIAKEKAEAEERERIRLENEKLKKEAEEREKVLAEERKKAEEEKKKQEETLKKEREEAERKRKEAEEKARLEKERLEKENQEKLKREREEREKVEAELKAKQEEEERKKREEQEKIEAQKKASDKDKLLHLADNLKAIEFPEVKSKSANDILEKVHKLLREAEQLLRK